MDVTLTFTEPLLGTLPGDEKVATEYILSKNPNPEATDEAEAMAAEEVIGKGMTVFARNTTGAPILWDYQIKGFFKDACSMLRRAPETRSGKLKAHKKVIDGLIFVQPRQIPISVWGELDQLERPLRAETAQGSRVCLAISEMVPAGSQIEFSVVALDNALEKLIVEWLDYGALRGLGQWRNGSYGRFSWQER